MPISRPCKLFNSIKLLFLMNKNITLLFYYQRALIYYLNKQPFVYIKCASRGGNPLNKYKVKSAPTRNIPTTRYKGYCSKIGSLYSICNSFNSCLSLIIISLYSGLLYRFVISLGSVALSYNSQTSISS